MNKLFLDFSFFGKIDHKIINATEPRGAIINDNKLKKRDGKGIWETENNSINAEPNLKIINDGSTNENI